MSKPALVHRARENQINRTTRSQRLALQDEAFHRLVAEPMAQTIPPAYDEWFRHYFTFRPPEYPKVEIVGGQIAITAPAPALPETNRVWGEDEEDEEEQPSVPPAPPAPGPRKRSRRDDDDDDGDGDEDNGDDSN